MLVLQSFTMLTIKDLNGNVFFNVFLIFSPRKDTFLSHNTYAALNVCHIGPF